jgi:hypothetical protein
MKKNLPERKKIIVSLPKETSPALPGLDEIDFLFCDPYSLLHPSRQGLLDIRVDDYKDGFVKLSAVLPEQMMNGFRGILECLHELFKFSQIKTKHLKAIKKPVDLTELAERDKFVKDFQKMACEIFDALIKQGLPAKEAIKRTNAVMKERNYPHATYSTILDVLRAAGRLKKVGLYKKVQK